MTLKFEVTEFDPIKAELEVMVESVKDITADPKKITKEELELVHETHMKLVKQRTTIDKVGKEKREVANKYSADVIAYVKELTAIILPEEKRLKEIKDTVKEHNVREVRREKLPEQRERLDAIGADSKLYVTDDELLAMDPNEFEAYYNDRVAAKNESDRLLAEEKERTDLKEREDAQAKKDADAAKIKAEQDAKQKEIDDAAKKVENDRLQLERDKELEEAKKKAQIQAEKDAKEKAELEAKEKIEAEEKAKKEAKEKIEKEKKVREEDEKYQVWLKENGYTEEEASDFLIKDSESVEGQIILYKKIGVYDKTENN